MIPLRYHHPAQADHAQLYETLVGELTDFVVFLMDPTGCMVSWNPGIERILGYTEAEWLGQSTDIIFNSEDRAQGVPSNERAKAIREGRASDIRWHVRKNGDGLYVEGTLVALRDETGQLLGFSKVMRDITERKRRELALQDAVQYAESVVDTVREPLLVLNGALRVQSANRNFYRIFQVSAEETQDRLLYELGNGQWNIPLLQTLLEEILPQDKAVENFEVTHHFPQIGPKTMLLNARKLWREGNHTELILLAIEDITKRREVERERELLLQEVQRSNEELTQFAHVVSHDLQAPIRGVQSFSQLLLRRYEDQFDTTAQEYLQLIANSAESMHAVVRTLLSYATVGQGTLILSPVALDAVLEAVVASLRPMIEETDAIIESQALPEVRGDRVLLQQLVQNLLTNALKYRRPDQAPRIFIRVQASADQWVISVKDNGQGIHPYHHQRIFAPLQRLHGPEVEGTGMGLAVCKRIAERHGGRIWVESPAGEGATFYFTLPRSGEFWPDRSAS